MSRRRFYAPPADILDLRVNLSAEETHHLTRVLRLKPAAEVFVFDGLGREYRCRFAGERDKRAQLEIIEALTDVVESPLRITLAQALAKGEKFDLIVQKATELGVTAIAPLITEQADVKPREERMEKRLDRWQRISLEAMKQSGRRRLVEIMPPVTLTEFVSEHVSRLSQFPAEPTLLVFSEKGGAPIKDALDEIGGSDSSGSRSLIAFVGPEGGWSDDELSLLEERGSKAVSLGPRVLRTETAALVAIALIQHALGDLSS
jgi:16S rRNA (uracil1498-N3)-methyltransferase